MIANKARRTEKRVMLLALLPAIEKEVGVGHSLTWIYETHVAAKGISYSYFHQFVTDRLGLSRTRFPGRATKAKQSGALPVSPSHPMVPQEARLSRLPEQHPAPSAGPETSKLRTGPIPAAPRPRGFQHYKGPASDREDEIY